MNYSCNKICLFFLLLKHENLGQCSFFLKFGTQFNFMLCDRNNFLYYFPIFTVFLHIQVSRLREREEQNICNKPGVLKLLVLVYPQIKIVPPLRTPNSKVLPK